MSVTVLDAYTCQQGPAHINFQVREIQQEIVGLDPLICSKIKEWDYDKLCFYDTSYFGVSSLHAHIWLIIFIPGKIQFYK